MHRCIFCEFLEGKVQCTKSYENDHVASFIDWNNWEGVHVVAYTKKHIGFKQNGTHELEQAKQDLREAVPEIVKFENLENDITVLDFDDEISVGQDEEHIHIHVTGRRKD
ncbi:MAG: HIT domain-containing protein [Butyrivibrio sp.]|nr:HIT domain-containing protein [Butyrivibrio sp.]